MAKFYDNSTVVSIKNGGGIRSMIGYIQAWGDSVVYYPPQANPAAGKLAGDISQLDIENSLRFNNLLSLLTVDAAGSEQDAFAEYTKTLHSAIPYHHADTPVTQDYRIQNLTQRSDSVFMAIPVSITASDTVNSGQSQCYNATQTITVAGLAGPFLRALPYPHQRRWQGQHF